MSENANKLFIVDGDRVKMLRKSMNLSVKELSKKVNISERAINKIENNEQKDGSSAEYILKLADYFDISIDYLVGRCDEKTYKGITDTYHNAANVRARIAYEEYLVDGRKKKKSDSTISDVKAPWPYNLAEAVLYNSNRGNKMLKDDQHMRYPLTDDQIKGLEYIISKLDESEQKVVNLYFKNGKTQEETSSELQKSKERTIQIIHRIVRKMSRPTFVDYIIFGYQQYTDKVNEYNKLLNDLLCTQYEIKKSDAKAQHIQGEINNNICFQHSGRISSFTTINVLDLSPRTHTCLQRAGISTIGELICHTEEEIGGIRNLGLKSLKEIKNALEDNGLAFKEK